MKELNEIQVKLNAPKNQFNSFGQYNYRSCEDILQGLKPHLMELECSVIVNDDIVMVGDRIYVKATATIVNKEGAKISTDGFAREPLAKKGMDDAQVTGSASSYARKYALNGLFAIDDAKDMDYLNQAPQKRAVKFADIKKFSVSEFFGANNIDTFNACKWIADFYKIDKVEVESMNADQIKMIFEYQDYFIQTYQIA